MKNTFNQEAFKKSFVINTINQNPNEENQKFETYALQSIQAQDPHKKRYSFEPSFFDIRNEIETRLKQYQQLRNFIVKETISKIQESCNEKLRKIDSEIANFNFYLLNQEYLMNSEHFTTMAKKKLEINFHSLKKPALFYNYSFTIEKYKIPNDLTQAKNFVFSIFPNFQETTSSITALEISLNGYYIVVGRADAKVRVFKSENGEMIQQYTDLKATVVSVGISNYCQFIMAGLFDQNVFIWGLNSTSVLKVFKSRYLQLKKVCFTNDLKYIACVGEGNVVEVRRMKGFEEAFKNGIVPDKWLERHQEVHL
jgi:hypothetical protein